MKDRQEAVINGYLELKDGEEDLVDLEINDRLKPISHIRYLKKTRWDINSPKFKEAQMSLGYKDEDVTIKPIEYFKDDLS